MNDLVLFEIEGGSINVRVDKETVWLWHEQLARNFERERSVIAKHARKIFRREELGGRKGLSNEALQCRRHSFFGYRLNSRCGRQFRQWASRILRDRLTRGYAIDRLRLDQDTRELEAAQQFMRRSLAPPKLARDFLSRRRT